MSIGAGLSPLPRIAVNLTIVGGGRTRKLEGSQEREDQYSTNSNVKFCNFWSVFCVCVCGRSG